MADQDIAGTAADADRPASTTRPRRRTASRPAGPPPDVAAEAPTATKTAAKKAAPAKRAPRTAKKASKAPADATVAGSDVPTAGESDVTELAAKKPVRRSRKAALAPDFSADAVAAAPVEAAPVEAAPVEAAPQPVKRKRATKKSVAAVEGTTEDSQGGDGSVVPIAVAVFQAPETPAPRKRTRAKAVAADAEADEVDSSAAVDALGPESGADDGDGEDGAPRPARRRRRGGRGRGGRSGGAAVAAGDSEEATDEVAAEDSGDTESDDGGDGEEATSGGSSRRRRRRRRGGGGGGGSTDTDTDDPERTVVHVREPRDGVTSLKGSTRLEAKKQRRRDGRTSGRRRSPILSEAEFLARREAVDRVMVVRETGERIQIAVLEDDVLVEHYVDRRGTASLIGNVYLGRVQNVLPSMEAAFVDIGRGRNAVLYAGEVNWDAAGLDGQPRRIEHALKAGESVLVQVTKDPIGHKGARLTAQVTLPGRFLVYVPDGSLTGISRKLPDTERSRLKSILKGIVPEEAGVIVRTAAEGATEEELTRDVARLQAQWEDIERKAKTASAPASLYTEPDLTVRVVRDLFNEDFAKLIVAGDDAAETIEAYVGHVAPDLAARVSRYDGEGNAFAAHRIDEQLAKGLDRKVWLPSGGSLVIDRTEAMTVVDVNTGKFTGSGGNLEETVTRNNLEAAEEIVRQLRLRDIGGIIVVDFIDMVLEKNRDLVLRRLTECLARDRTKHQVAEVSSLGLVQMTRKRIGLGLLESFSESCEHCNGRGLIVHSEPVDPKPVRVEAPEQRRKRSPKKKSEEPAS